MQSTPSASLVVFDPVFGDGERLALTGFLAGYRGATRDAYSLDLRQFVSWCDQHQLSLFGARRADIECYARGLEGRGLARATVSRRLCTVAGLYRYAARRRPHSGLAGGARAPAPAGVRISRRRPGPQ